MKLLERLRARPGWQDEDPAVRAAAVRALAADDDTQELLVEIARGDDDAVVRCEALRRIENIDDVVSIGRSDPDEAVRTIVSELLRAHALETPSDTKIVAVLEGLSERDLALVSRSARSESVSVTALSRLTEDKWLGTVARGASRVKIAMAALDRMKVPSDVRDVALKSEQKLVALHAFDRLSGDLDAGALAVIAKRAKQKVVARRARSLLAELNASSPTNEPSESTPEQPPVELPPVVDTRPPDFEEERSAIQETQQQRIDGLAVRRRLCQQVDGLRGADAEDRLAQLRQQWNDLPALEEDDSSLVDDLAEKFTAAIERCEERGRSWVEDGNRLERLESLVGELEKQEPRDSTESDEGTSSATQIWRDTLAEFDDRTLDGETQTRLEAVRRRKEVVDGHRRERDAATRSEQERQRQENLKRLEQLCAKLDELVASDSLERQVAERHLRDARRVLDDFQTKSPNVSLPSRRARETIGKRLKHTHAALLGRVRELRDFADWQRWANLGVQETLCAQLEALASIPDDAALTARYRQIMNQWRQAADLPKGRGEELRQRFQTAHDAVYPRCQAYLDAQAKDRDTNLSRRRAIIEEAERLATSTDWLDTVKKISDLQAQWKEIGPVPRRHQQDTWRRFRAACNTFFARRKEDLAARKEEWSRNLERKQEIASRVEALGETDDLPSAIAEVKKAQAEWKTVGPVRRKQSDAVWRRFRAACDGVFARAQAVEQKAAADKAAVREALCDELEALLPAEERIEEASGRLAEQVRDIQQRWRQAPDVPQNLHRALGARFGKAVANIVAAYPDAFRGTELDPSRRVKRLDTLCRRVESLAEDLPGGADGSDASPVEILATKWRDALASNLMGAKGDEASRVRAVIEEVKKLQVERRRLGQLPGKEGEALAHRFQRACDRVFEASRTASRSSPSPPLR